MEFGNPIQTILVANSNHSKTRLSAFCPLLQLVMQIATSRKVNRESFLYFQIVLRVINAWVIIVGTSAYIHAWYIRISALKFSPPYETIFFQYHPLANSKNIIFFPTIIEQ